MRLDASHGFCLSSETQYVEVNDPFRIPTFAVGMYHDTRKDFDYGVIQICLSYILEIYLFCERRGDSRGRLALSKSN